MSLPQCPECNSSKVWKDGLRKTSEGYVQRYICRECGYRFSETSCNSSEDSQHVQKIQRQILNCADALPYNRQVSVALARGSKNLAEVESRNEKQAAGATEARTEDIQGKIVEFLWYLKKQGRSESTLKQYARELRHAAKSVNILDPEEVKKSIAEKDIKETTKCNLVYAFQTFYKFLGIKWNPPQYKAAKTIPFIPQEQELNILISNASKTVSAFLQLLKETGIRSGEALKLQWSDIDFERHVVRVTPEKNSSPRILPLSQTAIAYLQRLPKKRQKIFNRGSVLTTFFKLRKRLAFKLNNPRLMNISFHTFRHWKATMEYHKTKDILHVMQLLGHRNIQNTLIYITIDNALFQDQTDEFHVKTAKTAEEACKLVEVGFEYVNTICDVHIYRKRK